MPLTPAAIAAIEAEQVRLIRAYLDEPQPVVPPRSALEALLVDVLAHATEPMTRHDLTMAMRPAQLTAGTVWKAIEAANAKGAIVRVLRGRYALPQSDARAA